MMIYKVKLVLALYLLANLALTEGLWVTQRYDRPSYQVIKVNDYGLDAGGVFKLDVAWKMSGRVEGENIQREIAGSGIDVLVCQRGVMSDAMNEGRWITAGKPAVLGCLHLDRLRDCLFLKRISPSYFSMVKNISSSKGNDLESSSSLNKFNKESSSIKESSVTDSLSSKKDLDSSLKSAWSRHSLEVEWMGHGRIEGKVPIDWTPPDTVSDTFEEGAGPGLYSLFLLNCPAGYGPLHHFEYAPDVIQPSNQSVSRESTFTSRLVDRASPVGLEIIESRMERVVVQGIWVNVEEGHKKSAEEGSQSNNLGKEMIHLSRGMTGAPGLYLGFAILYSILFIFLWIHVRWTTIYGGKLKGLMKEEPAVHGWLRVSVALWSVFCILQASFLPSINRYGFLPLLGILPTPATSSLMSFVSTALQNQYANQSMPVTAPGNSPDSSFEAPTTPSILALSSIVLSRDGSIPEVLLRSVKGWNGWQTLFYPILPWILLSLAFGALSLLLLLLSRGLSITTLKLSFKQKIHLGGIVSLVVLGLNVILPGLAIAGIPLPDPSLFSFFILQFPLLSFVLLLVILVGVFKSIMAGLAYQMRVMNQQLSLANRFHVPHQLHRPLWLKMRLIRKIQATTTVYLAALVMLLFATPFVMKEKEWVSEMLIMIATFAFHIVLAFVLRLSPKAFHHIVKKGDTTGVTVNDNGTGERKNVKQERNRFEEEQNDSNSDEIDQVIPLLPVDPTPKPTSRNRNTTVNNRLHGHDNLEGSRQRVTGLLREASSRADPRTGIIPPHLLSSLLSSYSDPGSNTQHQSRLIASDSDEELRFGDDEGLDEQNTLLDYDDDLSPSTLPTASTTHVSTSQVPDNRLHQFENVPPITLIVMYPPSVITSAEVQSAGIPNMIDSSSGVPTPSSTPIHPKLLERMEKTQAAAKAVQEARLEKLRAKELKKQAKNGGISSPTPHTPSSALVQSPAPASTRKVTRPEVVIAVRQEDDENSYLRPSPDSKLNH